MEREVGGGIGMGNTCKPMAVSFQCKTKFTTIKKKLKKNKTIHNINERKKKLTGNLRIRYNYKLNEYCMDKK